MLTTNGVNCAHDIRKVSMKKNKKQIAALICVILLVLLYIATLIVAWLDLAAPDLTECLLPV